MATKGKAHTHITPHFRRLLTGLVRDLLAPLGLPI